MDRHALWCGEQFPARRGSAQAASAAADAAGASAAAQAVSSQAHRPTQLTERQRQKRMNGVFFVLSTRDSSLALKKYINGDIDWIPETPDPVDPAISKRKWEAGMQKWRNSLKSCAEQP